MASTVVVIPCYNEAKRLDSPRLLRFVQSAGLELLLVNDGSTDNTSALLHELPRASAAITVLDLEQNAGKAEAVRQGTLRALARGAHAVGYWDADLATPLETTLAFREVLRRRPDIHAVLGARLPLLGHQVVRHLHRQLLGNCFAWSASQLLRLRLRDTQCGAKLFRVTPELREVFAAPFRTRWLFDVEILARLARLLGRPALAQRLFEYPLEKWTEKAGSKIRSRDFLRIGAEFLILASHYGFPRPEHRPPRPSLRPALRMST